MLSYCMQRMECIDIGSDEDSESDTFDESNEEECDLLQ